MARKQRFNMPGIPQHVIQRGNNREPCFYAEDDYRKYLECLQESAVKFECEIHACVLMTNHVHLLITPLTEYSIPQLMQSVGRKYVRYINATYRRTGTLWEGRYKASLVDTGEYFLTCMRYIELNPVRANMVTVPCEYEWSSYRANAYGKRDDCLTPHLSYKALGSHSEERCRVWRELFSNHLDYQQLHAIREALNLELVLGRDDFKDKVAKMTNRAVSPGQPGRPRIEEFGSSHYVY